jgi:TatD DNase family protein
MNLIDSHAHLYLDEFGADISVIMERAVKEGVSKIYLPAIDHSVIDQMLALETGYPEICHPMIGVHPCSVKEDFIKELQIAEDWLKKRRFSGIGEVGLDFYWDTTFIDQQYEAFEQQINWGKDLGLPIIIHSRQAGNECLGLIKKHQDGNLKGIFHCFSGDATLGKGIIDSGFLLGIGGVITYKNSGVAESLKEIPLEYMVLETDAPYLTPVPFRGKRNESSYLKYIVQKLAEVKGVSVEEVAAITTANAQKIFGQ